MAFAKPKHVFLFVASLTLVATVYVFTTPDDSAPGGAPATPAEESVAGAGDSGSDPGASSSPAITGEDEKQMMAGYFRQQYGTRINNPYWQLKMLEKLMLMLKEKYPQDWEQRLREILMLAFPELAETLMKKLTAFNEYGQWIDSLKGNMTFADDNERRRAMWDKRVALFGEEAYVIWEAQYKNEQFSDRLTQLDQSTEGFADKSRQYIDTLTDVFGSNALQGGHTTQKIGRFLELPSVQTDLSGMPAEQRREQLREFRQAMGLDEAALQRWDELDLERDQVRAAGQQYMQLREQLSQQYKGSALTQKITELQDQLFGPSEAKYIRNEEESGYYRFNHPQKIGFN